MIAKVTIKRYDYWTKNWYWAIRLGGSTVVSANGWAWTEKGARLKAANAANAAVERMRHPEDTYELIIKDGR